MRRRRESEANRSSEVRSGPSSSLILTPQDNRQIHSVSRHSNSYTLQLKKRISVVGGPHYKSTGVRGSQGNVIRGIAFSKREHVAAGVRLCHWIPLIGQSPAPHVALKLDG